MMYGGKIILPPIDPMSATDSIDDCAFDFENDVVVEDDSVVVHDKHGFYGYIGKTYRACNASWRVLENSVEKWYSTHKPSSIKEGSLIYIDQETVPYYVKCFDIYVDYYLLRTATGFAHHLYIYPECSGTYVEVLRQSHSWMADLYLNDEDRDSYPRLTTMGPYPSPKYITYHNGKYDVEIDISIPRSYFVDIPFPSESFWKSAQNQIELSLVAFDPSYEEEQTILISTSSARSGRLVCDYLLYRSNGVWKRRIHLSDTVGYSYLYEEFV